MKKITIIGAMAALIFSCSKNNESIGNNNIDQVETIKVTANITMPQSIDKKPETRISSSDKSAEEDKDWNFTWDATDMEGNLHLVQSLGETNYSSAKYESQKINDGDLTAQFSGTLSRSGTSDLPAAFVYITENEPITKDPSTETLVTVDGKLEVDLTKQNGDLNSTVMVSDNWLIKHGDTDNEEPVTISPYLKHIGAFIAMTIDIFNAPSDLINNNILITGIECNGGFNTKCKIDPTNYNCDNTNFFTENTKEAIMITLDEPIQINSFTTYFNILPTKLAYEDKIKISLSLSDGSTVSIDKIIDQTVTLNRATVNTTNVIFDFNSSDVVVE